MGDNFAGASRSVTEIPIELGSGRWWGGSDGNRGRGAGSGRLETALTRERTLPDSVSSSQASSCSALHWAVGWKTVVIALSNAQYDQARSVLGDDYDSRLERYAEVAGDTSSETDDTAAREFEAARENQRFLTNEVQRYRQQYAAYRQHASAVTNARPASLRVRWSERVDVSDRGDELTRLRTDREHHSCRPASDRPRS